MLKHHVSLQRQKKPLRSCVFIFLILLLLNLVACQSFRVNQHRETGPTSKALEKGNKEATVESPPPPPPPNIQPPVRSDQPAPSIDNRRPITFQTKKIAVIVGPGGAKSFAALAALKALQDEKITPQWIAGMEWGAAVGAMYAKSGQYSELEWLAQKFSEDWLGKKSLLGSQPKPVDSDELSEQLKKVFSDAPVDSFRIKFTCPTLNAKNQKLSFLNRGSAQQVVQSCLGYPPYGQHYGDYFAATKQLRPLAEYLRSQGAEMIILINVISSPADLGGLNGVQKVLWDESAFDLNFHAGTVDEVISIPTHNYDMSDFDRKREMLNEFSSNVSERIKTLRKKWRL